MSQFFTTEMDGSVKVVIFDRKDKDMNVLSEVVLRDFEAILQEAKIDKALTGLVFISGKSDQFIVGADVKEFAKYTTAEAMTGAASQLQQLFSMLGTMPFPTVSAINGPCLGGGLEMSLACTWRIATDEKSTGLALPEIQLGLIPGAGGTQRLPRLIGIQSALDMILTGKKIGGPKALKMGLVDACVPKGQLREQAVAMASKKRSMKAGSPVVKGSLRGSDLAKMALEGNPIGRRIVERKAREMVDQKTKGFYPASYKALQAVFDGYESSLADGLKLEATLFGQLALTKESHSLIHLFHATTAIKKNDFRDAGKEKFGDRKTEMVGVIGAGFMGAGIATVCADKGLRVRLSDPNKPSLGKALKHINEFFQKKVERRRLKTFEASMKLNHISPSTSPIGLGACDIVVEAVFEDLGLKQNLLKQVEESANPDVIFASNTSALPISEIAQAARRPENVIGMHFFSPVEKMPLLEVVITEKTAPWVTARTVELGRTLGKQVIVVKDSPGFYTTRALAFYLAEAAQLLIDGCSMESIDRALTDFGYPVGPITLIDEVGIDVGIHVLKTMEKAFPERLTAPAGLRAIEESGRLGRKNNKGFYLYQDGKKGGPDGAVYDLIRKGQASNGAKPTDEILDRCNLLFVNECVRCLEEGILPSAYEGDVGMVFGLGFPPFWGGPFHYIDMIGAKIIAEKLKIFASKYGKRFEPAKLLTQHAESGKLFFPDEMRLPN